MAWVTTFRPLVLALSPLLAVALSAVLPCGPLDLRTALDLAGKRSDEVAIKQAEVATAEVDRSLARSLAILPIGNATFVIGPDPAAHGTINSIPGPGPSPQYTGNTNRSLNDLGAFERVDVTAVQPLWTWGQLSGARDAARAGLLARQHLLDDTLSQVQLRVIQLYWGDALARKFLAIAADVEKAIADVEARVQKSLKAEDGTVSPSDKYQLAVFKAELAGRKAEAIHGQELARIGLAATLALARDELQIKEVDLSAAPVSQPTVAQALARADLYRPDLLALSSAIDAKKGELQAKEGALFPQLFIAGQFSYAYAYNRDIQLNPWVSDPFNELTAGVVLGVRQDLNLATLVAQKNKSRSELLGIERQYDGLRRLIATQVETALADLTSASARFAAAQEGLAAGKSWFRAAGLDFEAGVGDTKSLLTAYRGYVESQLAGAQAAYDITVAKARLDQATAQPLVQGEPTCVLQ